MIESSLSHIHIRLSSWKRFLQYSYSRHPSYVGFFWWAVATQLLLGNIVSTIAFIVILGRFFSSRIIGKSLALLFQFPLLWCLLDCLHKPNVPMTSPHVSIPSVLRPFHHFCRQMAAHLTIFSNSRFSRGKISRPILWRWLCSVQEKSRDRVTPFPWLVLGMDGWLGLPLKGWNFWVVFWRIEIWIGGEEGYPAQYGKYEIIVCSLLFHTLKVHWTSCWVW